MVTPLIVPDLMGPILDEIARALMLEPVRPWFQAIETL